MILKPVVAFPCIGLDVESIFCDVGKYKYDMPAVFGNTLGAEAGSIEICTGCILCALCERNCAEEGQ